MTKLLESCVSVSNSFPLCAHAVATERLTKYQIVRMLFMKKWFSAGIVRYLLFVLVMIAVFCLYFAKLVIIVELFKKKWMFFNIIVDFCGCIKADVT